MSTNQGLSKEGLVTIEKDGKVEIKAGTIENLIKLLYDQDQLLRKYSNSEKRFKKN